MIDKAGVCAPSRVHTFEKFNTCLTFSELRTLAIAYNKVVHSSSQHSIKKSNSNEKSVILQVIPLAKFKTFRTLYKALYERFKPVCGDQTDHCWIEQDIFKTHQEHSLYRAMSARFRPVMNSLWLKNRRELLNTFDILKAMKQYEEVYPDFAFCGVFPIDFMSQNTDNGECVVGRICHFDLKKYLQEGIKHMGVVLNFDPHDKPGSHWVAVYANLDDKDPRYGYFYYDSYAGVEPPQVQAFYHYIEKQFRELHGQSLKGNALQTNGNNYMKKPFTFQRNMDRHQFKDTECGMFSMIFLVLILENPKNTIRKTLRTHLKEKSDDLVNKYRDVFYRRIPQSPAAP